MKKNHNRLIFYARSDGPSLAQINLAEQKRFSVVTGEARRAYWSKKVPNAQMADLAEIAGLTNELAENRIIVLDIIDPALLSATLIRFTGAKNVKIYAPITPHYFAERPLFINSMPKSGTHLLSRCVEVMGFKQPPVDAMPDVQGPFEPQTYYNLQHLRVSDFAEPYRTMRPFVDAFSRSVMLYICRDPRDLIVSLANYIPRQHEYHLLSEIWRGRSLPERISAVIKGDYLIPVYINQRFRLEGHIEALLAAYRKWQPQWWPNLWPIRYEDLVGPKGLGTAEAQRRALWGLQLALHVPGRPEEFAGEVFDERSVTFYRGSIGQYQQEFSAEDHQALDSLSGMCIRETGYAERWAVRSNFVVELSIAGNLEYDEVIGALYTELSAHGSGHSRIRITPRKGRSDASRRVLTLAVIGGRKRSVKPPCVTATVDSDGDGTLSGTAALRGEAPVAWTAPSYTICAEQIIAACAAYGVCERVQSGAQAAPARRSQIDAPFRGEISVGFDDSGKPPELIEADFHGFNIVHFRRRYFAVPIARGAVNLASLPDDEIATFRAERDAAALKANLTRVAGFPAAPEEAKQLEAEVGRESVDSRGKSLEDTLEERDVRLRGFERSLQELRQRVRSLERTIDERDQRIQSLEDAVDERDRRLGSLSRTVARDAALHLQQLHQLEETVEERTGRIASFEGALSERDARLVALEQNAGTLQQTSRDAKQAAAINTLRIAALENESVSRGERLQNLEETIEERSQRLSSVERVIDERYLRLVGLENREEERDRRIGLLDQGFAEFARNGAVEAQRVAQIEEAVEERTERIAGLERALDAGLAQLASDVHGVGEQVRNADEALAERTARLISVEQALDNGFAQLAGDVQRVGEQVRNIDEALAERTARLVSVERTLDDRFSQLADEIRSIGQHIRSIDEAVAERTGRLVSVERALNDWGVQFASWQGALEAGLQKITTYEPALAAMQELKTLAGAGELRLQAIETTIAERDRRVVDLEMAVSAADTNLSELRRGTAKILGLDSELADLRLSMQRSLYAIAILQSTVQGVEENLVELRLDRVAAQPEPMLS